MTWKTQLDETSKTVRVVCAGGLSPDDLTMLSIETSFLAKEHSCGKVLIDLSDADLDFLASELTKLLDTYAEYHLPPTVRTGMVFSPNRAPQDLRQLMSTAKGYGYQVDVLSSQQSEAWLSAPSP
ncbi:MAG TPA: hypothetical protein VLV87_06280 [Gammaproteobacteria bacterium]|nr:hypothetical protein [Gammaproteobacteria bacterium]